MADKEVRINLIEKDNRVLAGNKYLVLGLFIGVFMLSAMVYSLYYTQTRLEMLQSETARLHNECYRAETGLKELVDKKNRNELLQRKISSVSTIKKSQTSILNIIEEVEKAMPPGIRLVFIQVEMEEVALQGYAPAHTPEALMLGSLRNSSLFGEVMTVVSEVNEKAGNVSFKVTVAREEGE